MRGIGRYDGRLFPATSAPFSSSLLPVTDLHAQPAAPTQHRHSPLARAGLGWFVLLVVYASLYPFAGWTDTGVSPFAFLLQLIVSLNMALFVFNLIPLLPLDGGHVAGALWEGLKRGAARLLRRPDPGHVDVAKAMPLAYAVSSVLIVMTVLLVYADLVKPIKLGG